MAHGSPFGMASRDIVLCIILTALLYSSFGQTMSKSQVQPEFLALLENHTVTQGRDVSFTCVVNHLQSYMVAWIKSDSRAILAIDTHMVTHNPRLSVTHNGHNTWKLHVTNVQPSDSGTYMCQVNTDPMKSQTGHMKVVIPPDIMDLDDSVDLLAAMEYSDVRLRCRATGTPPPVVTWRREDGRNITLRTKDGEKQVKWYEGERLHLTKIQRQEMGSYLCIASNGVPPSVSKRHYVVVRFKPLVKVSNQLVVAPTDSDVVLHCYVESSLRTLYTWRRDDDLKLLNDEKHELSEIVINDYSYHMNLTVRRLEKNDFGSYTCSAENMYGRDEGTIRLQELHLPRTTPPIRESEPGYNKHARRQQSENQGNIYSVLLVQDGSQDSAAAAAKKKPGNTGHRSTPTSSRNRNGTGTTMTGLDPGRSRATEYPAPTPAPAHLTPTDLQVPSNVARPRLHRHGLIMALIIIVTYY